MVGVDVGDDDRRGRRRPTHLRLEPAVQSRPGIRRVPAGVDDRDTVVELEDVDEHVAKRVVRQRDRDRPEAGTRTSSTGGQPPAFPGLASAAGPGDLHAATLTQPPRPLTRGATGGLATSGRRPDLNPATSCSQSTRAAKLRHAPPAIGAQGAYRPAGASLASNHRPRPRPLGLRLAEDAVDLRAADGAGSLRGAAPVLELHLGPSNSRFSRHLTQYPSYEAMAPPSDGATRGAVAIATLATDRLAGRDQRPRARAASQAALRGPVQRRDRRARRARVPQSPTWRRGTGRRRPHRYSGHPMRATSELLEDNKIRIAVEVDEDEVEAAVARTAKIARPGGEDPRVPPGQGTAPRRRGADRGTDGAARRGAARAASRLLRTGGLGNGGRADLPARAERHIRRGGGTRRVRRRRRGAPDRHGHRIRRAARDDPVPGS